MSQTECYGNIITAIYVLTGDAVLYCDGCTFLIPTDDHGNPLINFLCPVSNFTNHYNMMP